MSLESYSALDESSLRALLDGTVDLDERRLIRSAIRELRRREIEDMEAALASKRFRPTRLRQQEDKENQHRSESSDNLDNLSRKLQSIQDIDELTKMLRAAGEYEERKLIRAAIRQVRDEQQQGTVECGKAPGRCLDPENFEPQSSLGTGETEREIHSERERIRSQIQDLRGQQTQQSRELQRIGSNSGMVLVLDHLVKDDGPGPLLIQPQREAVTTEPELVLSHRQRSDSSASDRSVSSVLSRSNLGSVTSEKSQGSPFRPRLDSGASDRSQSPSQRGRLDSGASERSIGSQSYIRQRLGSDVSDSGSRPHTGSGASDSVGLLSRKRTDSVASDHSVSMSSEDRGPAEEVEVTMSGSAYSTDSETESGSQAPAKVQGHIIDQDQPDGAVLSHRDPANGLLNGIAKGKTDSLKQKITANNTLPVTQGKAKDYAPEKKDVVLEQLNRTNSVRDRMRKFTEPNQSPTVPALKKAPLRNGTISGSGGCGQKNLSRAAELFRHTAASHGTSGDGQSHTSATSQSHVAPQPRGGAYKPLSSASQWQNSMGGTRNPAEKDVHASTNSKEDRTPGRAAGQQVTQGEADPDMKTFLTIEIKDGRTTTSSSSSSSSSSSRGNIVPITNMAPRINTNVLGQRAELTLGLRATPFKISSSTISSGSSIKFLEHRISTNSLLASVTQRTTGLAMPGVNLDFLPASEAPEVLDSPDSACAESGLEEIIGDLLAQEEVEDEDDRFCKRRFESTLRCAVGEIHSDLQAFGKRVDARLEEAAARVAPLAEAFARLQEENLRMRIQQERLVRQVETLCQVLGLPDPLLHGLPSKESSPSNLAEAKSPSSESPTLSKDFPTSCSDPPACTAHDTALEVPQNTRSCSRQDSLSSSQQDTPLDVPSSLLQEPISCRQHTDSTDTNTSPKSEPSPVPHPPTFATCRSLSAPALMANISCDDSTMETEPVVASEPVFSVTPSVQVPCHVPAIPNGSSTQTKPEERAGKLTVEQLAAIEDEELLDKMLDESKDFEERKMIRQAMRDLRKKKREVMLGCTQEEIDQREKERETRLQELRQQRDDRAQKGRAGAGAGEVVMRKVEKSADGSSLSQVTKTDRFAQSDDGSRSSRSTVVESSYVQKTDRGTVQSKSYSFSSSTSSSSSSNTSKKVGSVFDREDDTSSRSGGGGGGGLAAVERKQAERRKELMRAQTLPKTSAMQARKAMIEKLEKEGGGPGNQAVAKVNKVQRSTSFGVPNANSIKQMLLDWCRAKTRSYEHVNIQNFSSSWSNGMAFCALVHNFFPESFDYGSLSPSNRRQNFEVAFSTAEKLVDCPQLLDVDDMVKMREPDWKCVYTYLQEFYRGLVTKGLVKTKNSS